MSSVGRVALSQAGRGGVPCPVGLLQGECQSAPPFTVLTGTGQALAKIGQAFTGLVTQDK